MLYLILFHTYATVPQLFPILKEQLRWFSQLIELCPFVIFRHPRAARTQESLIFEKLKPDLRQTLICWRLSVIGTYWHRTYICLHLFALLQNVVNIIILYYVWAFYFKSLSYLFKSLQLTKSLQKKHFVKFFKQEIM